MYSAKRNAVLSCLFLAASLVLAPSLPAAVVTKSATGTDLTAGASWGGAAPGAGDTATWLGSSLGVGLTLGSDVTWGAVDVEGALTAVGISGVGTLTLGGGQNVQGIPNMGIYLAGTGQNLTLGNPIVLGTNQTWSVGSGRTLGGSGLISGPGMALTLAGPGAFSLGGANNYSGGTVLTNGCTVTVGNAAAFGIGTLTLAGGTVNLSGLGVANPLFVPAGASANVYYSSTGNSGGLNGPITGSGTIVNNDPTATRNFFISGDLTAFTGTIDLENGGDNCTLGNGTPNGGAWNGSQAHFIINTGSAHPVNFNGVSAIFQMGDLSGSGCLQPYNTHLLQVGALNTDATFSGALGQSGGGTLGLSKVGVGTQVLAGPLINYTGATTVNAGTLLLSNATAFASAVTVNSGGVWAGTGSSSQSATINNGGTLSPGLPSTLGTLSLGSSLTLGSGSTNVLRLNRSSGLLTNDQVKLTGSSGLTFNGVLVVVSNPTSEAFQVGDKFTLFAKSSGTFSGAFVASSLPALPAGRSWSLGSLALDGSIQVVSTATGPAVSFTPPAGGYIGAQTVTLSCTNPGATLFYTTDGSTPTTNSMSGPSGLTVSVPLNTTLTINAFASTPGSGAGTLASATYGTVATPVWVSPTGGSWATPARWSNNVVAAGADLTADFSKLALANDVTVTLDGARTIGNLSFDDRSATRHAWTLSQGSGGPLTLAVSSGSPIVSNNVAVMLGTALAGASGLAKTGAGALTLTGANTYDGGTMNKSGTLVLQQQTGVSGTITTASGAVTEWRMTGDMTYYVGVGAVTFAGAGRVNQTGGYTIYGDHGNNGYFVVSQSAGALYDLQAGRFQCGGGGHGFLASNLGSLNVNSGAFFELQQANVTIDALTGGGSIANNQGGGVRTLTLGAASHAASVDNPYFTGNTASFTGAISDGSSSPVALTKLGSGAQVLAGPNTYTGPTTISAGTLLVNGSLGASSAVTVSSGATLGGSGVVYGPTTVQSGGMLAPGAGGIGALSISNSLALAAGAAVRMEASKTNAVLTSDRVQGMSGVTYGGTLLVSATGDPLAVGDKLTLFPKASGAYNGSFAASVLPPLAAGLAWDTSGLSNDGSIQVVATNAVMTPMFNPPAGVYSSVQSVTIASTIGSTIYYTLDGSTPTTASASGLSPIANLPITSARTLKAFATKAGLTDSPVATASYTMVLAPDVDYSAASGGSLAISVSALLARGTGATALQSLGLSANGATVSFDANGIYYAAGPGTANPDSFPYTVTDGRGNSASGRIYVHFVPPASLVQSAGVSNGVASLNFAGLPNGAYLVQTTTNSLPASNWWTIGMSSADANGLWSFAAVATNAMQFYRAVSAGNLSVGNWLPAGSPAAPAPLASVLEPVAGGFRALSCSYTNNNLVANRALNWSVAGNGLQGSLQTDAAVWSQNTTVSNLPWTNGTAVALQLTATLISGQATSAGVAAAFDFGNWSTNNYVLVPASIYNGNRFRCEFNGYDAALQSADWYNPNLPLTQSDVPRLSQNMGDVSRIELLTGNAATPAMCFFSPARQQGFILLTDQATRFGNSGLMIEESADRSTASFVVSAPGVRKMRPLFVGFTPSGDAGAAWSPGDSVTLNFQLYSFPCANIPALLDVFHSVCKNQTGPNQPHYITPFSQLQSMYASLIDTFYTGYGGNRFYADENGSYITFGWVGGLMNPFPMLALGDTTHLARMTNTFNFAIPAAQGASGYFVAGLNADGTVFGRDNYPVDVAHVRKNADVLYWMIKQLMLLKAQGRAGLINLGWEQSARNLANAFTNTWNLRGEFGNYVSVSSGDIVIYNSTAGAQAPGALALAAQYFNEPGYLAVAQASASFLYNRDFVGLGQTDAHSGDTLQNSDADSAYAFTSSLMALYETTGDTNWLNKAQGLADLFATWTISYDYVFPAGTPCYNLGAHVAGAVWASSQNKHAVAVECTSSCDALFKLYRAGHGRRYAELVRDIAACANDLTARSDRPTYGGTPGSLMERVQITDAEGAGAIGELPSGVNQWCVLGGILMTMELPGIYVRLDTADYYVFDHVTAVVVSRSDSGVTLDITNPTPLAASVTVFGESATQAAQPLGYTAFLNWPRVSVNAGATVRVLVKPDGSLQTL
jgi:autotransporter-associated beta strand protein